MIPYISWGSWNLSILDDRRLLYLLSCSWRFLATSSVLASGWCLALTLPQNLTVTEVLPTVDRTEHNPSAQSSPSFKTIEAMFYCAPWLGFSLLWSLEIFLLQPPECCSKCMPPCVAPQGLRLLLWVSLYPFHKEAVWFTSLLKWYYHTFSLQGKNICGQF